MHNRNVQKGARKSPEQVFMDTAEEGEGVYLKFNEMPSN